MIEIELIKRKLILLLVAGVMFVISGFLCARRPEDFISIFCRNPELIRVFGIAAICFFGTGIIFLHKKCLIRSLV